MAKTYQEINEKIKSGDVVVVTAEEVIGLVKEIGIEAAAEKVDIVTTATFGPMCSSGAFLNFGHSDPPIRMEKITLNDVPVSGGLAAVDTYVGATEESNVEGYEYGGAHVICDLIAGKDVHLKATGKGTDCYPRKEVEAVINKETLNEAYMFNPRNCYQNYAAAINTSDKPIYTYMGTLQPNRGSIHYSTTGELSPLLKDPTYRTIGIGTRIFFGGAQGYVSWRGTQFNSAAQRDENGIPLGTGGTLALIGDLKQMSSEFVCPAVFEKYGVSMYVGVGIPIPVLDVEMMKSLALENKDIYTNVVDYSIRKKSKPTLARVSYEELQSGAVEVEGQTIRTAPISSMSKSRKIAKLLKKQIEQGEFFIQEPVELFDTTSTVKALPQREDDKDAN